MKKLSMETLVNYINDNNLTDLFAIRDEMATELNKNKVKADANRAVYAAMHDKVMQALSAAANPVTAQEIANETGFARGKIVYGLRNYWDDEVVIDSTGKVNTYRLA